MTAALTGSCQCGTVRYRSDGPYSYAVHCHCRMCQRSSGAAFMTWVCVAREGFSLLAGTLRVRATSATVTRAFCPDCGAHIYMDYADSPTIDLSIGTLDRPEAITVTDNIWTSSRLPMMKAFDPELPSHPEFAQR